MLTTAYRPSVAVQATDPISEAGVRSQLRHRSEIRLDQAADDTVVVVLVVADTLDEPTVTRLRSLQRTAGSRVVLVCTTLNDEDLILAIECGVVGVLRRSEASSDRLVSCIRAAAAGEGSLPPDLLGRLLGQVGQLQRTLLDPTGIGMRKLAPREIDVLRLVADGYDTGEIAAKLAYSERTVKNVLHDVTTRLQLRNRSHAVAFALREGLI
jgi:DNA-binding NarL/FixJ family response regulator